MASSYRMKEIKIVLADDHEVVRAGLKRMLEIDKTLKVVGEANNGEDALSVIEYHKPEVAILDIMMPRMNGIEAALKTKEISPDTFVVMLTAFEDLLHIEQALDAGADGYLTKDVGARELIDSVKKVVKGDRVFTKSVLNLLEKRYASVSADDKESISITPREQEIINLVAQGLTSPEIAEKLNISVRTAQTHRFNVMKKLGVRNAVELTRYALTKKKT